jgi:hypothetical protein
VRHFQERNYLGIMNENSSAPTCQPSDLAGADKEEQDGLSASFSTLSSKVGAALHVLRPVSELAS